MYWLERMYWLLQPMLGRDESDEPLCLGPLQTTRCLPRCRHDACSPGPAGADTMPATVPGHSSSGNVVGQHWLAKDCMILNSV